MGRLCLSATTKIPKEHILDQSFNFLAQGIYVFNKVSSCFCAHILCAALHKNAVNALPVGSATAKCECIRLLC